VSREQVIDAEALEEDYGGKVVFEYDHDTWRKHHLGKKDQQQGAEGDEDTATEDASHDDASEKQKKNKKSKKKAKKIKEKKAKAKEEAEQTPHHEESEQ
jgi:hypothetical protein